MGGQVCAAEKIANEDPLALNYGHDERETGIQHIQDIKCNNKEAQKILLTYIQNLRNDKTLYKDPSLPTDPIILKSKLTQFRCSYERPYKFLDNCRKGEPYKLIDLIDSQSTTIQVKDQIMQYFGVFLCFLADKPTLIQKIICTNQNSYGLHCIQAYRDGRVVHFFVDDYILCRESRVKPQPVFSQPQKNMYMWPCILEKAWFKIKGNSAKRVQQNTPEEIFQTFLPLPIQKITFQEGMNSTSPSVLNEIFYNYEGGDKQKGYIFKSKRNPDHDIGLSGSKYFYLLDTFVYDNKRMFYLRNPCGQMHFRGMHDQISPQLQQILEKRKLFINAPGNFLIDEEEFIEQINELLIINYLPGNKISTYCFQCENEQQFFLGFDLKYKGLFNLCIIQNAHGSNKGKNYYPIIYHVIRLSDMKLIGGNQNKEGCFGSRNTYLLDRFNEDCVSSKYLIRLKKKVNGFVPNVQHYIVGYCMEPIRFELPSQYQLQQKWKEFLRTQGSRQLALVENGKPQKAAEISHIVCWIGDIAFVYIQKRSKKPEVNIQVNFPELMNLQCISHPQIKRSDKWNSYKFTDYFIIIFQKIDLTAETHIRQYHLQAY